jgi:hypothetical protein
MGNSTCMLASGTTENTEDVVLWVEASGLRECTNWPAHGLICHADKPESHVVYGTAPLYSLCLVRGIDLVGEGFKG